MFQSIKPSFIEGFLWLMGPVALISQSSSVILMQNTFRAIDLSPKQR